MLKEENFKVLKCDKCGKPIRIFDNDVNENDLNYYIESRKCVVCGDTCCDKHSVRFIVNGQYMTELVCLKCLPRIIISGIVKRFKSIPRDISEDTVLTIREIKLDSWNE